MSGVDLSMVEYLVPLSLSDEVITKFSQGFPHMVAWLARYPYPVTYVYRNACRSSLSDFNLIGKYKRTLL
jgi:hypothetical protein